MPDPKLLNFLFIKTGDELDFVNLKEVLEIWEGKKNHKKDIHEAIVSTFDVGFVQLPGDKPNSLTGHYVGLRKRTARERLDQTKIVISVGTTFEAEKHQELLKYCEVDLAEDLIDVRRIITGCFGNLAIAILEPSTRGPIPQYAAMREILKRCHKADHFYKSGGMAGTFDMGDIIVAGEGEDGVVVEDLVLGKKWMPLPGFPGPQLRQVAFEVDQSVIQKTISTGAELTKKVSTNPYEIEASGFLTALERHGAINENSQFGIVGVISDNSGTTSLKKKSPIECFEDLIKFWKYFLEKLEEKN